MSNESEWHNIEPYASWKDPFSLAKDQPSFIIAEWVLIFIAIWGILDCRKRTRGRLIFLSCLLGGTMVELLTILNKQIGNFYHSQASMMLFGNREPLYMLLGCYGWIPYAAIVLSRKIDASALTRAAFAGLLGSEMWSLLDTVGAKFLWWTWHNDEPLYADREADVPIASSFWIMSSIFSLSLILSFAPNIRLLSIFIGPAATLVLMNVPFMIIYHPIVTSAKYHASVAMNAFRFLCILPLLPKIRFPSNFDTTFKQIFLFTILFTSVALFADPTAETRTSFSQPCGIECEEKESSFWGQWERQRNLCNNDETTSFHVCDEQCEEQESMTYYTSCGLPMKEGWIRTVIVNACMVLVFATLPFKRNSVTNEKKNQ